VRWWGQASGRRRRAVQQQIDIGLYLQLREGDRRAES
jgi:hypothetical protein